MLAGERDYKKRWLYSAAGKLIEFKEDLPLTPRALWWDGDPQKEVIFGRAIQEVVTCVKGELRIYTTTIPAPDRRPCLLQDHLYRMGVVAQTMGYYYPAQLGVQ